MKLTQEQAIELLQKVGVTDAEIVTEGSDYDQSAALTAIDNSRKPIIRQLIEPELRTELAGQVKGETIGRINGIIAKKLNIPRSQVDKAESVEAAIEMGITEFTSKFDGDKAEMEAKYNELVKNMESEKGNVAKEWEQKYNTLQTTVQDAKAVEFLTGALKDAPTTWDRVIAAKEIYNHAKSLYDVKINDKGELEYYNKGTGQIALNEAGNEHVKHIDLAKSYLTPRNGWATDYRGAKPTGQADQHKQQPKNNFVISNADPLSRLHNELKSRAEQSQ